MRKIDFSEPVDDPAWDTWRNDCDAATEELKRAAQNGEPIEIRANLYKRDSIKSRYYWPPDDQTGARPPFYRKCVYCDRRIPRIIDIEHFRPKNAVHDIGNKPVLITDGDGATRPHPGYYWLAYDWTNLLVACRDCNIVNAEPDPETGEVKYVGKSNRFPIAEGRSYAVQPEDDLAGEQPVLINPLHEDPSLHLAVDCTTGIVTHRTERGRACIEFFGLNGYGYPEERLKTINEVRSLLDRAASLDASDEQRSFARDRLIRIKRGQESYTMASRSAIEQHFAAQADLAAQLDNNEHR